jgi:aerobic carbon-monoxide dehydrogenase small subunit
MLEPQEVIEIDCIVNGDTVRTFVAARQHLADFLREQLELKGTHLGCEHGVCGACTVLLDGEPVRGCLVLAAQVDGRKIETIEGAVRSGRVDALLEAFHERNAGQCGFCSPAMVLTTAELLAQNPSPSREEVREHISGNYCRCTGYQAIVDAVMDVAADRKGSGVRS